MRTVFLAVATFCAALAVPLPSNAQETENGEPFVLNLACQGGGLTGAYEGYDARLYVHIKGTGGEIQIPRQIAGGFRKSDTWFPLRDVVVEPDKISARYRAAALSSPRVEIDRIHGELRLGAGVANFEGVCSPYDPDAVQKAF